MRESILILGGTGFIGKNMIIELLKRGYDVYNISLVADNSFEEFNKIDNYYCDISNYEQLKKCNFISHEFTYVVNCSGLVNHCSFYGGGDKVIFSHYIGLINILKLVNLQFCKSFIQLDSSDSYGDNPAPQRENYREAPISSYSAAKTACTHLLQMLYKQEKLPVKILRLFLPYGPRQKTNMLIPQVIKGCLNNEEFPVSFGEQKRDFLYIDDLIEAILISLNNKDANGELINIAMGKPYIVKKVVKLINTIIGKGKPQFGKYPYREGENMNLYADISKANDILKWYPKTSLKAGILKTINYYKNIWG